MKEVGKRRVALSTLLLNPEGTHFNTLNTYNNDVEFGLMQWSLKEGSLYTLLRLFKTGEPALFDSIFSGDYKTANKLLLFTKSKNEDTTEVDKPDPLPQFNLAAEP